MGASTVANKPKVIEFNGESCSWCKHEGLICDYRRPAMEATREAVKNIVYCTSAYCSGKVTCDYYVKDDVKYRECQYGECPEK